MLVKPYPPAMADLNVSLPDALKSWLDALLSQGRFSSASEYISELMRRDQDEQQRLQQLWREGIDSGEPIDGNIDPADIARRARARRAPRRAA